MPSNISLEDRKKEVVRSWGKILANADSDTLNYFFRVLPIDLSVMIRFIKEFRPNKIDQAVKMYTIILNCSDFDFQVNGYPATLDDLLIAWKRSDSAFESHAFCRSLIGFLEISLLEIVGSFYPRNNDDYCILAYHLWKTGLYRLNYDSLAGQIVELIGFGFDLKRLSECSGGLSENRIFEIILFSGDSLSDEEKKYLKKIIDCPKVGDDKKILSKPMLGNTLDREKTPPPYNLLEMIRDGDLVPTQA